MASYGKCFFGDAVHRDIGTDIFKYHGYGMMVGIFVTSLVAYMALRLYKSPYIYRHFKNRLRLEYWWSYLPMILLSCLWYPSMVNLYHMDDIKKPNWTFKAIASQWYWSYEFELKNKEIFEFQSYMLVDAGKSKGSGYRLLDVDWRMVAPACTQITIYVSSTDVLHSFALPSASIKADAIPGRINQVPLKVDQCCILYGQCSEICGVNHAFMPIVVEFVPVSVFIQYLSALNSVMLPEA